jgi:hypothetical protein
MKQLNSLQNSNPKNKAGIKPEDYLSALKEEDYSASFYRVENWLKNKTLTNKALKKERNLIKMKNYFLSHKLRIAYTVIFLFALVAACNMPVTQTENVGNMITWSVDKNNTEAISKIDELTWLKTADEVNKNGNINNGKEEIIYTVILQKSSEEQIASFRNDLEKIGVSALKIIPFNKDVKRPLYSAALDNFFSIDINATGMSDEELQAEVQRQLKEQGVEMNIQFKTDPNGRRDITIIREKGNDTNTPKSYEINIDDKNGQEKIKLMQKKTDPDILKGKTDREIRDYVKKENPDLNLQDSEINIIREDGKVKVEVLREQEERR